MFQQSRPAQHSFHSNDQTPSTISGRHPWVWAGLVLLPVLLACGSLLRYANGLPYQDDYHAILAYQIGFHALGSGLARLQLMLAQQHNEYKLIFLHGILFLEDSLLHRVSFTLLQVMGDLFLLPMLAVLWFACFPAMRSYERRLQLFLPISLLLCGLNWWEMTDFAMCTLQFLPCWTFAMLALLLLTRPQAEQNRAWRFWVASLSASLAVFASPNALLLAPIGAVFLLSRQRVWRALLWCVLMAPALAVFLYRYTAHPHLSPVHRLDWARFLFSFLGAIVTAHGIAPFVGVCLLAALLYATLRGQFLREQPFFCLLAWWILTTALLVTYARTAYGVSGAVAGRYRINSDLLAVTVYVWAVRRWAADSAPLGRRPAYGMTVLACTVLCLNADRAGRATLAKRDITTRQTVMLYMQPSQSASDVPQIPLETTDKIDEQEYERQVLHRAIAGGIYRPPSRLQ